MKITKNIPIQQIDLSDETFSVNFMPDLQNLRSSIEAVGLIQPVLLRERPPGYQIVCGFRRVSILKSSGNQEVESRVFGEEEKNDLHLFLISLQENVTTRGFNAVEKALALEKLIHRFRVDRAEAVHSFLPLLHLEPNEKILNTFLSLAQMEEEVKQYVFKESVSRSNTRMIAAFAPEDRVTLVSFLSSLKLSENRLKEILTLLEEITRKNRCRVQEIARRPEIETIFSQKELTPSQKTERVKKGLMDLRYPRMRHKQETFEEKRKALHLPSGVSLHPAPFFEGKDMSLRFQFETLEEYQAILSSLARLPAKKEFQEMFLE